MRSATGVVRTDATTHAEAPECCTDWYISGIEIGRLAVVDRSRGNTGGLRWGKSSTPAPTGSSACVDGGSQHEQLSSRRAMYAQLARLRCHRGSARHHILRESRARQFGGCRAVNCSPSRRRRAPQCVCVRMNLLQRWPW